MCTLLLARDVVAPDTVLLAANRDEDPRRPSDPPAVLSTQPWIVGGRDRLASGTWLAVRGREAVVAILNRRDGTGEPAGPAAGRRSRGLLAIDVAKAGDGPDAAARSARARGAALAALAAETYAPFSLVYAAPGQAWLLAHEADRPARVEFLAPGWHAITHRDLDDRSEPRTARVLDALAGFRPDSVDAGVARARELLALHGGDGAAPVCLHEGRMVTVSSSIVWLAKDDARYLHAEGRPCETPWIDHTARLTPKT